MADSINITTATTEETTTTDTLNAVEETVSTTTENTKIEQEENIVVETTTQEETYPVKDLIENCKALTGYKKEIAVGALFNCEKQQMTKKEFQGRIKNFLGKKVK